ncbi:hypothetical protein BDW62DRAFT_30076 [Aspergillus aurantiobrunneus]
MTDFPNPSPGLPPEPDLDQHETGHLDLEDDPFARNVNFSNSFALMKAVLELRALQATTSVLRFARTNPVSIYDPDSTIRRAIGRRERRITNIVDSMVKNEFEEDTDEIAPPVRTPAQVLPPQGLPRRDLPQRDLSPSEVLEALETAEERKGGESFLRVSSSVSPSASISELDTLHSEDAIPVVDENVRGGIEGISGREGTKASAFSSSLPTPGSDSAYSSLGRSLSASNMQSVTSIPRQCKVVSAAQYTKIISEREPQFGVINHPYSIDSLVAESSRFDRCALEIHEHCQIPSADSFPGEFPVSQGLEYSSLATAKHHTRMPSIRTSVRPFSDL